MLDLHSLVSVNPMLTLCHLTDLSKNVKYLYFVTNSLTFFLFCQGEELLSIELRLANFELWRQKSVMSFGIIIQNVQV